MTWCLTCKLDQKNDYLALCKDLGHDIDYEGLFQITQHEINKISESSNKSKQKNENSSKKIAEFATSLMIKIRRSQSDNTRVFVIVKMNNHFETIELDRRNTKTISWLRVEAFNKFHEMYSEETCGNIIGFLRAKALMNEKLETSEIHLRIAYVNNEIYYDLGRTDWKLVRISSNGITFVNYSENTPIFIRTSKIAEQVEPNLMPEGDPLDEFFKFFNIPNPELFKVHLIEEFLAGVPIPIMAIHGHAGAAKSTVSSMIKRIIDPSGKHNEDNLKSFPKGEDNFVVSLSSSYFSVFENISFIDDEISNILCRAVTGGTFEKRAQYTNDEVFTVTVKRKLAINGIDFTVTQADLADRTIKYEFERIPENTRKTDKFLEEKFRIMLPDLLGQIFLILQKVLKTVEQVEKQIKNIPRMASFVIYGEAIYQALGHKSGEFQKIYDDSIKKNLEELYESNPVIPCLEDILDDKNEIEIQANELYKKVKYFVDCNGFNSKRIPQGSNGLSAWFTRSKTLLDENNIKVTKHQNKQSKRISGFTPNATIYSIKRSVMIQTILKNELDV